MDPQQVLQLKDIHIPRDVNIWPLAFGWWLLIGIVIVVLVALFLKTIKVVRIRKHKKLLREEYSLLEKKLTVSPSKETVAETNVLLRRLALAYYPNENVASLTGGDWLTFLDLSGSTQDFSRGAGRILIEAPYRDGALENYNGEEFIPLIRQWVNKTIKKAGGCA